MSNHNRKFDWNLARHLHNEGHTISDIARRFNVTPQAVRFAINDEHRTRFRAYHAEWQRQNRPHVGTCPDCGEPATNRYRQGTRCRACNAKHQATSVREDTLRCSACRLWLPDADFNHQASKGQRRGRHAICKPCSSVIRRDSRKAMTPEDRERVKEYDRKRRASPFARQSW